MNNNRDLRTKIGEIFVKWGLSTNQAAISELVRLCEEAYTQGRADEQKERANIE